MGRVRKLARWTFSFGGTGWGSPIAAESTRERLLREQNQLLARQTRLMEATHARRPAAEGPLS